MSDPMPYARDSSALAFALTRTKLSLPYSVEVACDLEQFSLAASVKNLEAFALFSAMDLAQKIGSPISAFNFIPSGKPVVVVEAVGLVKRAAVMWMVMSAAAKLEALLAAAEDKQMLILMSSALKSEMRIFVVVIAVKMIEVMQIIFGADPHGPVEEEQITPIEIPPVKDAAVVSTENQPSEPEGMEPLAQAPPRSPIMKCSQTGTAIRPPLRF
eukprot:Em0014g209a